MPIITWNQKLGRTECPYLIRWIFNLGIFSIRIHHWLSGDDKRYYHDHPWWFITLVVQGSYYDVSPNGIDLLKRWSVRFRPALHRHTVDVIPPGCWTLLVTGSITRRWGFWVNNKFKRAEKYFKKFGHHPCK